MRTFGVLAFALLVVAVSPAPCDGPRAMACVPATKEVETFFMDERVATAGELAACAQAGACPKQPLPSQPRARDQSREARDQARDRDSDEATTWENAERYCAWAGKRLPSEREWEAYAELAPPATTTTTPTTTPATTTTTTRATAASEGREWTQTWFVRPSTCPTRGALIVERTIENVPPALCGSKNALDPCDGAFFCGTLTQKVTKDPKSKAARSGAGYRGPKTARVRCASSTKTLTSFPSIYTSSPRAKLALPEPPTAAELALFNAVEEDVLDTPLCEKVGRSFADCRDPRTYLMTNEPRLDVVMPYLADLGGGYTGVGSDQSYTFVAQARSRWAWVFDYDPNVVSWHHVLRVLILASPTRADFVAFFDGKANLARGADALKQAKASKGLVALFESSAPRMLATYRDESAQAFTWLGSDERFAYIKTMYAQGRMRAFKGNMLDVHAMKSIGAACKALGVPMRIYYPSNAPEFWLFTDAYRANVRGLPFDAQSIVLQTISSVKSGFGQTGYWHYNVQLGFDQQRLLALPGYTRARQLFVDGRVKTDTGELTITALPSR